MAKNKKLPPFFSSKDQKAATDKRTKLYRLCNGIKDDFKVNYKLPTEAQATQQLKFGMATSFAHQLKQMINIGLKSKTKKMTAINFSTRQILQNAIVGEYPQLKIDYAKVIISDGSLDMLKNCHAVTTVDGCLILTWEQDPYAGKNVSGDDLIFLTVYNMTKNVCHNYPGAAKRSEMVLNMPLPYFSNDDTYHCWIFMASTNLRLMSTSTYYLL